MTRWTLFLVIGGCGSAHVGAHPGGTSTPTRHDGGVAAVAMDVAMDDGGAVAMDDGGAVASDNGGMAADGATSPSDPGSMGSDDAGTAPPGPVVPPDSGPPPADPCVAQGTCPANTWVNVTPKGITIPTSGLRSVVRDPSRPSDLYLGSGEAGIWKSTDGGATFRTTGGGLISDLYSFSMDPYDINHLISGLHEHDGIAESIDAGETWHMVGTAGFPTGGISWFPTFLDTGAANTTSKTWFAIAQNGGSPVVTRDGGNTWTIPTGLQTIQHPHGEAQIFQRQRTLFVPGVNGGAGDGVYRSTDFGATFTRVTKPIAASIAWGSPNHVYSMWAWSCFGCVIDPKFMVGSANGDTWTSPGVPKTMLMGADHVAVTSDGSHYIFVAATRSTGLWRYVEQ